MLTQASDAGEPSPGRWSHARLIAFRFVFAITALSSLHLSIIIPPYLFFGTLTRPAQTVVNPLATAALRAAYSVGAFVIIRVSDQQSSLQDLIERFMHTSGVMEHHRDTRLSALAEILGLAIVSLLVAIVWSYADRRRANYERLYRWMRVYVRYMLALAAMIFAVVKVVPTQFGFLAPGEVLRPVGQLSPSRLLWDFMAASTLYSVFAGLVELVGVLLLFFRRTTMAGALVLGAALMNVVVMDVGYRVGANGLNVALLLLILDLIVLLPYVRPAVAFAFLGHSAALPPEPGLSSRPWRYAAVVSCIVFALLVSIRAQDGFARRRTYFGSGHPVWGLFDVETLVRNGATTAPVWTDATAWRRIATGATAGGRVGAGLTVQFANADVRQYVLKDDAVNRVWTLGQGSTEIARLRYAIESDGGVSLEGQIGQDPVKMQLRRVDPQEFPLLLAIDR